MNPPEEELTIVGADVMDEITFGWAKMYREAYAPKMSVTVEARASGAETFVLGVRTTSLALRAMAVGVRYMEGPAIRPACRDPQHAFTQSVEYLYSQKLADAWIALPNTNPMFGGDSPLNYFKKGGIPALLRVRQLLDARRGGR